MSDDNKVLGSKWYKFDFHVHTPMSSDYRDMNVTPEQWLLAAMSKGLDAVVVTDHNSGEWVDKLKTVYESLKSNASGIKGFRELVIFPGVEITADHGIHLLGVFDPSCDSNKIVSVLAQCEIIDRFG
jgi:predicted metal-dependent phosphoesterase TrpH